MIVFGITITLLLFLAGILKSKSTFIFLIQCLWFWIIQAFNCGGVDYESNKSIYLDGGIPTEWLARILIKFFLDREIDYIWYRVLMATISILIIAFVVYRQSKRPCVVLILYWSFMIADNIAQCRFFWSMCFIMLAFNFWVENKKIIYFLCVFMAMGFHTSAFIYLLFPLLYTITQKVSCLKNIVIIIAELILIPALPVLFKNIGLNYIASKYVDYMYKDNYSSIWVGIVFLTMYSVMFYCIYWIVSRKIYRSPFEDFSYRICNSSVFILPFLLYNSNFGRYFRPILILSYIVISNNIGKCKRGNLSHFFLVLFILMTALGGLVLQSQANWFGLNIMFENNYLIQKFF